MLEKVILLPDLTIPVPVIGGAPLETTIESMGDPGPRLLRWRLIERLAELAAPADDQLAYISGAEYMGTAIWELAAGFWEWTEFLPSMVNAGVVPVHLAEDVENVVAGVRAIRDADDVRWTEQGSNWLHTPEALARDPMWQKVRRSAQKALDGFGDLGLPIPSLSDQDFNTPREDAP
jgi:hypothetical protein